MVEKTIVEKIVNRELDAAIVYESTQVIAFADHDPINFGHILICPVLPYESLIDLPDPVLAEINQAAKELYHRIEQRFKPRGISFIQNNGECNELSHYHLHIFPRLEDDEFSWHSRDLGIQTVAQLRASLVDF